MKENLMPLQQLHLFSGLSPHEMELVNRIAIPRLYRKKSAIFIEGAEKEAVFFIQDGLVKAYKTDEEGREHIVSLLQTGDLFPHTGFFNHAPYPATTEALVDTHLLAIPVRDFELLIMEMPSIAVKLIDVMGAKLIELQQRLQQMSRHDVNGKLASLLKQLATKHGEVKDGQIHIDLPITNQELASLIGTSRETVNRFLNQLKKQNAIKTTRSGMIILDKDALDQWE
jgi:CRP/FNR family transcriptional regulator